MSGNRSLDEFGDAGSGDAEPADGSSEATAEADSGGDEVAVADPEPTPEEGDAAEVASAADEGVAAEGRAGPDDGTPSAEESAPDDAAERPASSYAWHPDGAACDACGAAVEERWRDEDGLVCADCKAW